MSSENNSRSEKVQEELEELLSYREKVTELLRERQKKFKSLEQDRLRLSGLLAESSIQKLVRSGEADKIIKGDQIRRSYAGELKLVESALVEAREELRKANERLQQVNEDIRQLADISAEHT
jgi:ABC-type transporter Mla MlaB component